MNCWDRWLKQGLIWLHYTHDRYIRGALLIWLRPASSKVKHFAYFRPFGSRPLIFCTDGFLRECSLQLPCAPAYLHRSIQIPLLSVYKIIIVIRACRSFRMLEYWNTGMRSTNLGHLARNSNQIWVVLDLEAGSPLLLPLREYLSFGKKKNSPQERTVVLWNQDECARICPISPCRYIFLKVAVV